MSARSVGFIHGQSHALSLKLLMNIVTLLRVRPSIENAWAYCDPFLGTLPPKAGVNREVAGRRCVVTAEIEHEFAICYANRARQKFIFRAVEPRIASAFAGATRFESGVVAAAESPRT